MFIIVCYTIDNNLVLYIGNWEKKKQVHVCKQQLRVGDSSLP